jgi:integrase/recombinase XerC
LDVGDIRGKKILRVVGKAQKSRVIPLSSQIQKLSKGYFNGDRDDSPLFRTQRGGRLSNGQIQVAFKRYLRRAGIQGRFSVHAMRHSFASHVYAKTKDLLLVSQLLGHSSVQTSMRYSHLGDDRKREAVQGIYE